MTTRAPAVLKSISWGRSALLHGTYCISWIKFAICNYAQKRRKCENTKYAPDEKFCGHFCPRRKAASFCQPDVNIYSVQTVHWKYHAGHQPTTKPSKTVVILNGLIFVIDWNMCDRTTKVCCSPNQRPFQHTLMLYNARHCHRPTILISDLTNMTIMCYCESSRLVYTKPLPKAQPHIVQSQCTSWLFVQKSHLSRRNTTFVTPWQLFNNLFGKKCILWQSVQ